MSEPFATVIVGNLVCRTKDVMLCRFGNGDIMLRPIMRVSGDGKREDLLCYYPMDFSLTQLQNEVQCVKLMRSIAGTAAEVVLTFEETTLAKPAEPATVETPCEKS